MNIQKFQSAAELRLEHPEIKNYALIFQAPHGRMDSIATAKLQKAVNQQGQKVEQVFQIGDLFYIPAQTMPKIEKPPQCICLEVIGDNGACPTPGHTRS